MSEGPDPEAEEILENDPRPSPRRLPIEALDVYPLCGSSLRANRRRRQPQESLAVFEGTLCQGDPPWTITDELLEGG